MIRHIVLFSARHAEDIGIIEQALTRLADIRSVDRLEVARNARKDSLSDEIDVIVYAEFRDERALSAYKADPVYQETIQRVRPLRNIRIAVDFEAPGDP